MKNKEKMDKLYKDSLKYYCYLDDAMGIDTTRYLHYEQCNCDKIKCFHEKVNNKCYEDPDGHSRQLYEDIAILYNDKAKDKNFNIVKGINPYNFSGLFVETNDNRFRDKNNEFKYKYFSTDYIGPSRSFAKSIQVDSKMIGQTLRICRTIGGHIFWPGYEIDNLKTINCTKGGNPLCDRIDYALAELKNFLDGNSDSILKVYNRKQKQLVEWPILFEAFERYKDWFDIFGGRGNSKTFENFIKFMFLDDAEDNFKYGFVDKDYNVINLITNKRFEKDKDGKINLSDESLRFSKEHYDAYARNLCKKILKRTERIKQFAEKQHLIIQDTKNKLE